MKFPSFCLLLVLFYVHLDGMSAKVPKSYAQDAHECLGGIPPSACNKRLLFFPFSRTSPSPSRLDPIFSRSQRVFGLVKQPRVGRSEPDNSWLRNAEEDNRDYGHSSGTYRRSVLGEKEENLKNLEYYLSTQRKESNAPWAFFLITPNFQTMDQLQSLDNLFHRPGDATDDANEE